MAMLFFADFNVVADVSGLMLAELYVSQQPKCELRLRLILCA